MKCDISPPGFYFNIFLKVNFNVKVRVGDRFIVVVEIKFKSVSTGKIVTSTGKKDTFER